MNLTDHVRIKQRNLLGTAFRHLNSDRCLIPGQGPYILHVQNDQRVSMQNKNRNTAHFFSLTGRPSHARSFWLVSHISVPQRLPR